MQVEKTDLSNTEVKLTISAGEAELTPIKEQTVRRLGKNIKVAGFREGKAPLNLIEKNLDQNLLQGDFLDEAMTQLYAKATREHKIRPVTRPQVNVKKFVPFSELEFEVTTHVIGKIKLPDYTKISVPKEAVKVTANDIDKVIESLQMRLAERKEVARAAKTGDEVSIDFKGVDDKGEPIKGADATDYPLQLGSDTFIPGFEDNIIGLKPDEEKTFELTFPKDYGVKALANKKVKFTVKLKKVTELVKPELSDEFAAKIGPFKSVEELKADIKKQLTLEREREAHQKRQNEVLKAVSDKTTVEIPQALIDQQVVYNLDEVRRNLSYRGQTFQEYLESEGKTEDEYKAELRKPAEEQLKASLILAEIAEKENLSIEPEELKMQIQLLKGQHRDPKMQEELDKPENQSDIASRMLSEKVVNFLLSHNNK